MKLIQSEKDTMLFFTSATGVYENFIIPYIFFGAKYNRGSLFEFIISNKANFQEKNAASLNWLSEYFDTVPVFHDVGDFSVKPIFHNSLRFIIPPTQRADFVYIGDVDIMILENVLDQHRIFFDAGLPYSNITRARQNQLTGLHFTRYQDYYPLLDNDDLIEKIRSDEALLFAILARRGVIYANELHRSIADKAGVAARPLHGVHMSLNRMPFFASNERPSWNIKYKKDATVCNDLFQTAQFQNFYETLSSGSRKVLLNLIFIMRGIVSYGEDFYLNAHRR